MTRKLPLVCACNWVFVFEAPTQCGNTSEENDSSDSDKNGILYREAGDLAEIDQSVQDGNNVVDAEDKWIEHTGRTKLEAAVEVIELSEGEEHEPQ